MNLEDYRSHLATEIKKALGEADELAVEVGGNLKLYCEERALSSSSDPGRLNELMEAIADSTFSAWQLTIRANELKEQLARVADESGGQG